MLDVAAGAINCLFTLEQLGETTGAAQVSATVLGEFWGSLEGLTGTHEGGLIIEGQYRVRTRYREDIDIRTTQLGVKGTTRKLIPVSAVDPDGRRRELVIQVREIL